MDATELPLLGAAELLDGYARGDFTPLDVLQSVLERIARLNPQVNAFAAMNPAARAAAADSTARWRAARPLGALDGVPCTVKDLVDVAGLPTRRGSLLTDPAPVAEDAPLVLGLKAAGAVILGKTTTTEFGWKSPGDCPLHGITRNPWALERTPGGSSSGAAAASAAGFGALHVGTDAGGSIRIPAAWSGRVGLKPSFGLVAQWPAGAFATVACAGPIAATVRDAALMLGAMAGPDPRDPFSLPDLGQDFLIGLEDGVAGLRIGVLEAPGFDAPVDAEGIAAVERAAAWLADAGAALAPVRPALPDTSAVFGRVWGVALARLVASFPEAARARLDPGLLAVAAAECDMSAIAFMEAMAMQVATGHALGRLMQRFDLLLCPSVPGPPPLADAPLGDPLRALWQEWAPWTFAFNLSRQPAIAVPAGLRGDGLPASVQLVGAQYADALVLRAARAVEARAAMPPVPFPPAA
ncbi:MAG: amidase [Rhodospirillales bacterium]|nr:amidase [Rhodospirillales bacterium]